MMNILARIALLLTAIASLGVQATPKVTYYRNDLLGITKARKMNDGLRLFASRIFAWLALLAGMALSTLSHAGTITYYHNDLLGSPVVATNASGQVIWRESYRPYGERLTNDPNSASNKVWFTSRRQDAETGLVYMGARYYDPAIGRFLSVDPKRFDEANVHSFNRYAYANNSPYTYNDPNGKQSIYFSDATGNSTTDSLARAHNEGTRAVFEGAKEAIARFFDLYTTAASLALAADTGGASVAAKGALATAESTVPEGTTLYRVFGGDAQGLGRSWTTVDPAAVDNFRRASGIFPANTGQFVAEGRLANTSGVVVREALPGPGNIGGGLPEVVVPSAKSQICLVCVSGANPPF
jgi:RHS repeat-associated protein